MTLPLVTVIIPTYNYATYITKAIDSVNSSNYPKERIQIIVVDDGSADNTQEVLSQYESEIEYFHQENQGKASATALAIAKATGQYCFNLDADDYFFPDRIKKAVEIFEKHQDIVHVGHPAKHIYSSSGKSKIENIPEHLLEKPLAGAELLKIFYSSNFLYGGGSTFAARTEVLQSLSIPGSVDMFIDEYLLLHTLTRGNSYLLGDPLSAWLIHGGNFSNTQVEPTSDWNKKEHRTMNSLRAVEETLSTEEFGSLIPTIYSLKVKIAELHIHERHNSKTISHISSLALLLMQSIPTLGAHTVGIGLRLHIFQRFLPCWSISLLKALKQKPFPDHQEDPLPPSPR